MLGEKHDLLHEFPEHRERIHVLKLSDEHFARLFNEYHDLDHEIRRIEEGVETPSDEYLEGLKLRRLQHKDDLYQMIVSEG
ncbi:MAG: DUF465 domain-containing protein [Pseudomonadota bacterium]